MPRGSGVTPWPSLPCGLLLTLCPLQFFLQLEISPEKRPEEQWIALLLHQSHVHGKWFDALKRKEVTNVAQLSETAQTGTA